MQTTQSVPNLAAVAAFYGVTEQTVRTRWRPKMPVSCGRPGRWDLAEIGRWLHGERMSAGRASTPAELTNAEYERLLIAVEFGVGQAESRAAGDSVCAVLDTYRRTIGVGQVIEAIGAAVLELLKPRHADAPAGGGRRLDRTVVKCRECNRIRNGRTWIEPAEPFDREAVARLCPDCERKAATA